jgi:nucleoid DNA-binding protein
LLKKSTDLSYREAAEYVDIFLDTIVDAISRGEHIELRGLGSFSIRRIAARKIMALNNPEMSLIPAHGKIIFRPCQKLRESVWNREPTEA